jgi:tetratricopeptide (TPR) repeat protein
LYATSLIAEVASPQEEEVLHFRRIIEFVRDQEYIFAHNEIKEFLAKYPQSKFASNLYLALGDIAIKGRDYEKALESYNKVSSEELKGKAFLKKIYSHYEQQAYTQLVTESSADLSALTFTQDEKALLNLYRAHSYFQLGQQAQIDAERKKYYIIADEIYTELYGSPYEENAKSRQIQIAKVYNEYKKAAALYLDLIIMHPEKKEELLIGASSVQIKYDTKLALGSLEEALNLNGRLKGEVAFRIAEILYQTKDYQTILERYSELSDSIQTVNQKANFNFFAGASAFELARYEIATIYLSQAVSTETLNPSQQRYTLSKLTLAYYYAENYLRAIESAVRFVEAYPDSSELPLILLFKGLSYRDQGDLENAIKTLEVIINTYPHFEQMEFCEFEHHRLVFQLKLWQQSRNLFLDFAHTFPQSIATPKAIKYVVQSSELYAQSVAQEDPHIIQVALQQLAADIEFALSQPEIFDTQERQKYLFKLSKLNYDTGHYAQAIEILMQYLRNYPLDPSKYQVHLLLALSYQHDAQEKEAAAFHFEKTIELAPHLEEISKVHLELFLLYYQLSQETEGLGKKEQLLSQAAQNLYNVVIHQKELVQDQNLLWLASYYYQQVANYVELDWKHDLSNHPLKQQANRSIDLYKTYLGSNKLKESFYNSKEIEGKPIIETVFLNFARLLSWLLHEQDAIHTLKELTNLYGTHPDWQWKEQVKTFSILADLYYKQGLKAEALDAYKQIRSKAVYGPVSESYEYAQLQIARLSFELLPKEKQLTEDAENFEILKELKSLQVRKMLQNEPIHLEAALDYVEIRSVLYPQELQEEQRLKLLKSVKQHFTQQDDIWSKDYHTSRKLLKDKDKIYQAYMLLIDGQIAQIEATIAMQKGDKERARLNYEAAKAGFKEILFGELGVSAYLTHKTKACYEKLLLNTIQ